MALKAQGTGMSQPRVPVGVTRPSVALSSASSRLFQVMGGHSRPCRVPQTREGSSDLSLDADTSKKSQHNPTAVMGEAVRGPCSESLRGQIKRERF